MSAATATTSAFPVTIRDDIGKLKTADPRTWDRFYRTYERYLLAISARCGVPEHRRPEILNAVLVKVWSLCRGFNYRETADGVEFTVINPLRQEVWERWSQPLADDARAAGLPAAEPTQRLLWRQQKLAALREDVASFVSTLSPEIAGENPAAKVAQHLADLLTEAAAGTLQETSLLPNRYARFRYWLAAVAENECRHSTRLTAWEKTAQSLDAEEVNGRRLLDEIAGEHPAALQNAAATTTLLQDALQLAASRYRTPNRDLHFTWFLRRKLDNDSTSSLRAAHPGFSEATINQAICTVLDRVRSAVTELAATGRY